MGIEQRVPHLAGSRKAKNAAIEILLPIAAVAFGMSLFAIILNFTAH